MAEQDAIIFAEINKIIGEKMNIIDLAALVDDLNDISKMHKNVLDVNIDFKQNFLCYDGVSIKKDYRETLIFRSYRLNRETKIWESKGLNECCEGENFNLKLYPFSIVKEQIEEIKKILTTPLTIYRIGVVFSISQFESDSAGCAYLIRV